MTWPSGQANEGISCEKASDAASNRFPELNHLFAKFHELCGFKVAFGIVDLPLGLIINNSVIYKNDHEPLPAENNSILLFNHFK